MAASKQWGPRGGEQNYHSSREVEVIISPDSRNTQQLQEGECYHEI